MGDTEPKKSERPKREKPTYKYGGSLGWIASMIDPETSSWKPQPLGQVEPAPDRRDPKATDDSSS